MKGKDLLKRALKVDNKMRWLGETDEKGNIKINKKKHKGDKKELASTVKHELLHRKHPKMLEKTVYKRSRKTKLKSSEISKLLKKI